MNRWLSIYRAVIDISSKVHFGFSHSGRSCAFFRRLCRYILVCLSRSENSQRQKEGARTLLMAVMVTLLPLPAGIIFGAIDIFLWQYTLNCRYRRRRMLPESRDTNPVFLLRQQIDGEMLWFRMPLSTHTSSWRFRAPFAILYDIQGTGHVRV